MTHRFPAVFHALVVPLTALTLACGEAEGSNSPAPATAPLITQQPASLTRNAGSPATFSVAATGTGTLAYQWSKNGALLSGATSSSFTIAAASAVDAGIYFVRVSNAGGFTDSATATLTVLPGSPTIRFTEPKEDGPHAATWLQWPHDHTYPGQTARYDATWIAMTRNLVGSETVKIIAYDSTEQNRISNLLTMAGVGLSNVVFHQAPNDDVWIRDNGPVFVKDSAGKVYVQDWGFNGWGGKMPYSKSDTIPPKAANWDGRPLVDLNAVVLEGGALEQDGSGTAIATLSSVINPNRTTLSKEQMETKLRENLGITRMIWLDGVTGSSDITDYHIDGFFKFLDSTKVMTMTDSDLVEWGLSAKDRATIAALTSANGTPYTRINLPLTAANVKLASGRDLGYRGSYLNFYVANQVVLVPTYNDANDTLALAILQKQFPDRRVVGIDFREVYADGGMTHCVTQQEPKERWSGKLGADLR